MASKMKRKVKGRQGNSSANKPLAVKTGFLSKAKKKQRLKKKGAISQMTESDNLSKTSISDKDALNNSNIFTQTPANKTKKKPKNKSKQLSVHESSKVTSKEIDYEKKTVQKKKDNSQKTPGKKIKKSKKGVLKADVIVDVAEEYMTSWDTMVQQQVERMQSLENDKRNRKRGNKEAPSDVKKTKIEKRDEQMAGDWQKKEDFSGVIKSLLADRLPDMSAWRDLFVPEPVLRALAEDNFTSPTPIQTLTLPSAIRDRKDIVGAAETGSGKTLAFGIPVIQQILHFKQMIAPRLRQKAGGEAAEDSDSEQEAFDNDDENDEADDESGELSEIESDMQMEETQESHGDDHIDDDVSDEGDDVSDEGDDVSDEGDDASGEGDDVSDEGDDVSDDVMDERDAGSSNNDNSDNDVDVNNDHTNVDNSDENTFDETDKGSGFILSGQKVEFLDIPVGVDLGDDFDAEQELGYDGDDDDVNLSPGEEDEEMEFDEGALGCVRVLQNVEIDFPDYGSSRKAKAKDWVVDPSRPLHALILTPTRELAVQIKQHLDKAARHTDIQTCVVVGGMSAQKQLRMLKRRPEIIVATPGRLWELIQEGAPHISSVEDIKYLVIDEADRMVEKGHFQELSQLLTLINGNEEKKKARQSFVFSATLTLVHSGPNRNLPMKKQKKFKQLTEKDKLDMLMNAVGVKAKPKLVDLSRKEGTAESLVESRIMTSIEDKDLYIYYFIKQYPGRTLVFANSKDALRRLTSVLTLLECKPLQLHADMRQKQRLKNLDRFRDSPRALMLATDVAARGLDIPNVQHVIHFQVPRTSENYVHRSGRTARASQEGLSVMLVSADDLINYRKIIKTLNRNEELAPFPIEENVIPCLRERVHLARQIDKEQHVIDKQKQKKGWFEKAAEEADIELDNETIYSVIKESETDQEKVANQRRINKLKMNLDRLLKVPMLQSTYVGKYPTQSGRLQLPYKTGDGETSAAKSVKASVSKDNKKEINSQKLPKDSLKNKRKRFKYRSLKKKKTKLSEQS